jgi:hypothetical protein
MNNKKKKKKTNIHPSPINNNNNNNISPSTHLINNSPIPLTEQDAYYNAIQDTIDQQFDHNNIITIATHNVAGLSEYTKQTQLLQALIDKHIDIIGITDTRLKPSHAPFIYKNNEHYTS